jgi:hypothetical protein
MTATDHITLRALLAPERAPPPLDWAQIADETRLLAAPSLIYSSLRRAGRLAEVPDELRRHLQRAHATTTAHNLELAEEVRSVGAALDEAQIPWIPLKGAALLALDVYRDFGARPTSDIDVITDPADRTRVERTLRALGFGQLSHGGSKHLPPFERGNLLVEVHESAFWRLPDGSPTPLSEMRDEAGGPRLDQTVAHLVHHALESSVPTPALLVKTLCDLNEVRLRVVSNAEAAGAIASACQRAGLQFHLSSFAGALHILLDEPAPEGWATSDARHRGGLLLDRCRPLEPADTEALRVSARVAAMLRQPWPITAGFLRSHLFPPRAVMEAAYRIPTGSPLVVGAYALHAGKLLVRSAGDVVRLARLQRRGSRR